MFMVGTNIATYQDVYRYIRNIRGKLEAAIRDDPLVFYVRKYDLGAEGHS